MRMLDLFCGRWGWSKAFAARGWKCVGIDLTEPPEIPDGCEFYQQDVLDLDVSFELGLLPFSEGWRYDVSNFDFICASSPCEQFSVHGLKHFHPNPPYPELGIKLFNHTRSICEASGLPYAMENVRAAQQFVGQAVNHCGPFYLWGNAVPPLMPQGILKNMRGSGTLITKEILSLPLAERRAERNRLNALFPTSKKENASIAATIPPELAACVCDYAEAILREEVFA